MAATKKPGLSPALNQIAPQAREAEQGVLGCLMADADRRVTPIVGRALSAADFSCTGHRNIYEAALRLFERGEPTDLLMVAQELEAKGQLDQAGGRAYLVACLGVPSAVSNAPNYCGPIRETSIRRQLIALSGKLQGLAFDQNGTEPTAFAALATRIAGLTARLATPQGDESRDPFSGADLLGMELPPLRWAVPGLVPEGLTMFIGKPKIRKSFLSLGLVMAIASGGLALGSERVDVGESLYLCLEDPKRRIQERYRQLLGGADMEAQRRVFFQTSWERWREGGSARLAAWLGERPACRLVVIDTLARVRPTRDPKAQLYDEDYAAISEMKELADAHGLAIVVIHHARKSEADDMIDRASGSAGQTGAADTILTLEKGRGKDSALLETTGREIEERKLALEWDHHAGWQLMGDWETYVKSEADRQVLQLFARSGNQAMDAGDLGAELEISDQAAKKRLQRMAHRELLETDRRGSGRYRATAAGLAFAAGKCPPCPSRPSVSDVPMSPDPFVPVPGLEL